MLPRGRAGVLGAALRCGLPLVTLAWTPRGGPDVRQRAVAWPLAGACRCEGAAAVAPTPPTHRCRTYRTPADAHFRAQGRLPPPPQRHLVLPVPPSDGAAAAEDEDIPSQHGVLVVGDVHGCLDELRRLHATALARNGGRPFRYVVLVGDLVGKGPAPVGVLRHVRARAAQGWCAVRGNHDDAALLAALGDPARRGRAKYAWIFDATDPLSDEDVVWMANLPYTIRIPGALAGREEDVVVVHAGIIPGKPIEAQSPEDMVSLREVQLEKRDFDSSVYYSRADKKSAGQKHPWASVWRGKEFVLFGHDAARGYQEYDSAIGLDSGACYGKLLTGIILPEQTLVHAHAASVYCPIGEKDE